MKNLRPRHVFHFGVPGKEGTIKVPCKMSKGKHRITLDRTLADVLKGKPGIAAACADKVCAERHKALFPHPVLFVEFTRGRVYICDKMKDGLPVHCIVYDHNDDSIPLFDVRGGKQRLINEGLAERKITLKPPRPHGQKRKTPRPNKGQPTGERSQPLPSGAHRRAIEAGLAKKIARFAVAQEQ